MSERAETESHSDIVPIGRFEALDDIDYGLTLSVDLPGGETGTVNFSPLEALALGAFIAERQAQLTDLAAAHSAQGTEASLLNDREDVISIRRADASAEPIPENLHNTNPESMAN